VPRLGKVDEATTVTDYDDEAIARKHTLSASPAFFEWNKCKVNLIDTPGMGNFLSEARAALRVVEAAVVLVDAVSGVQVSTENAWTAAEELQHPRLIVVSRLDRESTGERIYDVMVLNSRTTYQFDKHFLVRFIANYDSDAHRVLTDFLASYEFVPGTVFHAGYGSLYERGPSDAFANDVNSPVRLEEKYRATNRGLFFKASYLKRF